jgi:2-acylglycerol O-acyltransferase 2
MPPSQQKEPQSLSDILSGFLVINVLYACIIGSSLFFLVGSFQSPSTIGLFGFLPYLTYTLFFRRDEVKDGNPWLSFSKHSFVLRIFRQYLGMTIQTPIEPELLSLDSKPNAQVILGVFPHGSYADYRVVMDGILDQALPNIGPKVRSLAATAMFRLPVVREIGLWTGCVDASRKVAERQLDKGRSLLIIPGGEAEQIRTENGQELAYVQKRKGFIKLALRKGVPVVPVYVFGASDMYHTSHAAFGLREWLVKNLGVAICLTLGKWYSPFCPLNVKTTIVFGKPIQMKCKTQGDPTDEEVQAKHKEFVTALEKLFDDNKKAHGYGDRKLQII